MHALGSFRWKRAAAVTVAALVVLTALVGLWQPRAAQAAGKQFTVVLQAGHSPSVYGNGNNQGGERESVMNEQVTQKTYNALKARGINVILLNPISLDRSLPSVIKEMPPYKQQYSYYSPEPAMLTALAWPERFDASITSKADLCISLHHNAYSNKDIRGYEIYYASTVGGDYGRTAADVEGSKKLARLIDAEFAKGFHVPARVPSVRDNTTNNGLTKSAPLPTVLVEAGYMSNAADLAALKSAANQQSMADKIAAAVVNYKNSYWSSQEYVDIRASSLTATYSESSETISVKTALAPAASVSGATMRVYPESKGPDAARTYELTPKGGGEFSARIGLEPFDYASGSYSVTVYGVDQVGRSQLSGSTQVTVTPSAAQLPEASGVTAELVGARSNTAVLSVRGVSAQSGVAKVEFAVWSEQGGQDDLKWMTAVKSGSTWVATLRTTDFLDRPGKYMIHAYVTDGRGNRQMVGETDVTFAHKEADAPELCGNVTYRKVGAKLILTASDVRDASGVKDVRFAFWGTDNQQRDLRWYAGRQSGSSWSTVITVTDHPSAEDRYTVHVYGTDTNGNDGCMSSLDFRLGTDTKAPTAQGISVTENSGTATIYVDGVEDDWSGVSSIDVAVWSQSNNQDDLRWYKALPDAAGAWTVQFRRAQHSDEAGPYHIVVYATDAAKNRGLAARSKFTFTGAADTKAPTGGTVVPDKKVYTSQNAVVDVKGLTDPSGIAKVTVEVSAANNAAGRKAEFTAAEQNGVWRASFTWSGSIGSPGEYVIRGYATDRAGNRGAAGEARVTVDAAAAEGLPIMGTSKATVAQLVNMQLKSGWSNGWYGLTVQEFCQMYYDICQQEGVRAEVAYGQMLHETGSLKYGNLVIRYQKNFAGLGATGNVVAAENRKATHRYTADGRDAGIVFTTVEGGIRSQIQHLKGYASTESLALPMVPEYDRFKYVERGCAPTLQLLSMKWATDASYGTRIQTYVENILAQSTTMPKIDTVIPSVIEANQKPVETPVPTPAPTSSPSASASVKPASKGEAGIASEALDEPERVSSAWIAPDPAAEPSTPPSADSDEAA